MSLNSLQISLIEVTTHPTLIESSTGNHSSVTEIYGNNRKTEKMISKKLVLHRWWKWRSNSYKEVKQYHIIKLFMVLEQLQRPQYMHAWSMHRNLCWYPCIVSKRNTNLKISGKYEGGAKKKKQRIKVTNWIIYLYLVYLFLVLKFKWRWGEANFPYSIKNSNKTTIDATLFKCMKFFTQRHASK